MIYPMMLKIDFTAIKNATKQKKGLAVTCTTNWLIKPFTMYDLYNIKAIENNKDNEKVKAS